MKKLSLVLIFSFLLFKSYSQETIYTCMVRFACDTCAANHNPMAYSGGNIVSADIVTSPNGNYLRLMSGSNIDTNATPAYFDIYSMTSYGQSNSSQIQCGSFRSLSFNLDFTDYGIYEVNLTTDTDAGYRIWLASANGMPGAGESTFQIDPLDPSSQLTLQGVSNYGNSFSLSSNTPIWADWTGKSSINMYGFTALTPNTEYRIYEVWINYRIPVKLAAYDCSLPNAVKNETLKAKSKIFPLPAEDFVSIEIPDVNDKYYVQILSNSGEVVYQNYHEGNSSISIANLNKGLYLMKVSIGDNYFFKKIVKE